MHKLIILIEALADEESFNNLWPEFLHLAEQMPGLKREVTSRVDRMVFGELSLAMIHELHFDSLVAVREAMSSRVGLAAGQALQKMTQGKMALLIADHNEDDIENILKYRKIDPREPREGWVSDA